MRYMPSTSHIQTCRVCTCMATVHGRIWLGIAFVAMPSASSDGETARARSATMVAKCGPVVVLIAGHRSSASILCDEIASDNRHSYDIWRGTGAHRGGSYSRGATGDSLRTATSALGRAWLCEGRTHHWRVDERHALDIPRRHAACISPVAMSSAGSGGKTAHAEVLTTCGSHQSEDICAILAAGRAWPCRNVVRAFPFCSATLSASRIQQCSTSVSPPVLCSRPTFYRPEVCSADARHVVQGRSFLSRWTFPQKTSNMF